VATNGEKVTLVPPELADELRTFFRAQLRGPVTLELLPGGATGAETYALLAEVAALSPRLALRVHPEAAPLAVEDERPAIVLAGAARGRIRFLGSPVGFKSKTLFGAILDVGRGDTALEEHTKRMLRTLARDVRLRVFVTPTCPFCPRAAEIAIRMAVQSARVAADVIAAQEFPGLVSRYRVQGVPKVVANDRVEFLGAPSESSFLAHVLRAAA
jgi:glutaredoxin-like protein